MDADISSQDRSYRRGLVLGFTLAEIVILIIFALLLALSWLLTTKDKEIEELDQRLGERETAVTSLTQWVEKLQDRVARSDDFDDLFQELVRKADIPTHDRGNALEEIATRLEHHGLKRQLCLLLGPMRQRVVPDDDPFAR